MRLGPARILGLAIISVLFLAAGCGGGSGAGGDQTPLVVCDDDEILLANGQCGPKPVLVCEAPEVAVDGRCIIPDKPTPKYTPGPNEAVIYYNRRDKNFDGWVLHLWNGGCEAGSWEPERITLRGPDGEVDYSYDGTGTTWPDGPPPNYPHYLDGDVDPIYGAYWVLQLQDDAVCGNFIVHGLAGAPQTVDLRITFSDDTSNPYRNMYWVVVDSTLAEGDLGQARVAAEPICINDICEEYEAPPLAIEDQAAHWIDADTIAWNRTLADVELYASLDGTLAVEAEGEGDDALGVVTGGDLAAMLSTTALTEAQQARFPHLADYEAYALSLDVDRVKALLSHQLWIVGTDAEGNQFGTQLQLSGVLDHLYTSGTDDADEETLGPVYSGGSITSSVWAPTAQDVKLVIYDQRPDGRLAFEGESAMSFDDDTGIWNVSGGRDAWDRKYYRFLVTAYHPSEGKVLRREARDPYSVSAYTGSLMSQFVDIDDDDLKPAGWDAHTVPDATSPEGAIIYEGHVRDFSARDSSTPEEHRGKFLAFTADGSAPVAHLQRLADAGVTHFHVLPAFDVRSIPEDPDRQVNLDSAIYELCRLDDSNEELCPGDVRDETSILDKLASFDPGTDEARKLIDTIRDIDGFNWGYDPVLYNVPEGSYSTDPAGPARIREMRAMHQALHGMGLRVVLDVVYNHTSDEGADGSFSVYDRIVPGYYYRRNPTTGDVERASCCSDTAAEHAMMAKFIEDSAVFWATHYGVDGFRFDWMSLHPKSVMEDVQAAVQAVDPDTYIYGEGWAPGTGTAPDTFELSTQANLAGTGIGTFNDRLRDRLRDLSISTGGDLTRVRAGLAGNLADFQLLLDSGVTIAAGSDGGYTADPQESVNYASVHDGMTLWDELNRGGVLPEGTESSSDRARMAAQAQSLVLLSQGVPFVHMGGDILRSKSLSHNSYNAGDWFNTVDFTLADNNWNVGLPPEGPPDADVLAAIADANADPTADDIAASLAMFEEFASIAQGSPLFSLASAEEVIDRVGFHNVGREAKSNLIAMSLDDGVGVVTGTEETQRIDLDPDHDAIVVVFNGASEAQSLTIRTATGFALHAVQQSSADAVVQGASFEADMDGNGTFTVPALTTAVFVKAQGDMQGVGLSAFVTSGFEPPVPYGDTAIYVRGQFNGWGTGNELTYLGGGSYEGFVTLDAGDYPFKIASADWSTVDIAAPEGQGTITVGEPATLSAVPQLPNLTISIAAAGEYRFLLDAVDAAAPVLKVTDARALPAEAFVRGSLNGWGTDDPLLYTGQGTYQASIAVEAGDHQFKIASSDWATVDLSAAGEGEVPIELHTAIALSGPRNPNFAITIPTTGDYLFTVAAAGFTSDDEGQRGATLWVTGDDPYSDPGVFLRGSMNGWGTDNPMTFVGRARYRTAIDLDAGDYEFKFASEDWSTIDIGGADTTMIEVGVPTPLDGAGGAPNLMATIDEADSYTFTLDVRSGVPTLTLLKTADVPPDPITQMPVLVEPLDFQDTAGYAFEDDAMIVTMVVADPNDAANFAARSTRSVGAGTDEGTVYRPGGAIAFSDDDNHLAVDVYSTAGAGTVALSVGSGDDAGSVLSATAEYTGSGAWETLYFDFSGFAAGTAYDWLKIVFDQGVAGDGSDWYWDNARVSRPPPGVAPPYGSTVVYVRGSMNGWGTDDALAYIGRGVYQSDLAVEPQADGSDHLFKIASEDWSTVNFGAASGDDTAVTLEAERTLAATDHNLGLAVAASVNYRFRIDASDPAAPILKVIDLGAAPYGHGTDTSTVYIRGAFNAWGIEDEVHYAGADVYEAVIVVEAGDYEFKVATEDWATVNLGGGSTNTVTLGTALDLADGGGNLALSIAESGEYLFTVDAANASPTLWVAPFKPFGATEVFVRGSINGWGTDDPVVFKGGARYAVHIAVDAGDHQFKVASEDWATVNLGAASGTSAQVTPGETYSDLAQGGDNLAITVDAAGTYRFQVDGSRNVPPALLVERTGE